MFEHTSSDQPAQIVRTRRQLEHASLHPKEPPDPPPSGGRVPYLLPSGGRGGRQAYLVTFTPRGVYFLFFSSLLLPVCAAHE